MPARRPPGCGRCVGQFCEGWICCDKEYCTQDLVRVAFTLFCFLQPLILCILYIANSHRGGVDTASTVIFCQLKLNHTTVEYKNLNTSTKAVIPMNLDLTKSECTEVDYILIALPLQSPSASPTSSSPTTSTTASSVKEQPGTTASTRPFFPTSSPTTLRSGA